MQKTTVAELLLKELKRANRMYGTSFASPHEGYAVILEELDELFEEIRQKQPDKERLREEAIQIGAMAMKFILSLDYGGRVGKRSHIGAYCRECRYNIMTSIELVELGSDPCETCDSRQRNWKGRS